MSKKLTNNIIFSWYFNYTMHKTKGFLQNHLTYSIKQGYNEQDRRGRIKKDSVQLRLHSVNIRKITDRFAVILFSVPGSL